MYLDATDKHQVDNILNCNIFFIHGYNTDNNFISFTFNVYFQRRLLSVHKVVKKVISDDSKRNLLDLIG